MTTTRARLALASALAGLLPAAGPVGPASDPAQVVVTGAEVPALAPFDDRLRAFLAAHHVPGAALAVARQSRLVYARGFGYSDLDAAEPVRPDTLFRIASVSKPITAAAVLQLIDRGKVRLDDPVLDHLGPLEARLTDPRWRAITVRQLLQHRGGWDRDASFDPMFRPLEIAREFGADPPAGPALVIRSMLGKPLDFDPGARYAYSNFGYCLLGRLIEHATGLSYEEAVRKNLLAPLGIGSSALRLGKTLPGDRAHGEAHYYAGPSETGPAVVGLPLGRTVPAPYGTWSHEALDAHGGWLASAPALLKFASAFDSPSPVLGPAALTAAFERPPGAACEPYYYACGWLVRPVGPGRLDAWHTGSLPGTLALLVRRADGLAWALLLNSRIGAEGEDLYAPLDPLLHEAADAVRDWHAGTLLR